MKPVVGSLKRFFKMLAIFSYTKKKEKIQVAKLRNRSGDITTNL